MAIAIFWWCPDNNPKSLSNFGDVLSGYLAQKITGQAVVWTRADSLQMKYAICGSILGLLAPPCIIWGCGELNNGANFKKGIDVRAVRGPLSRELLRRQGIISPEVYGDPALLLPRFFNPPSIVKYDIGIIPHFTEYKQVKNKVVSKQIHVINILDPVEKVITEIKSCSKIFSSSLHGLIVPHAYGIPAQWIAISHKVLGAELKFNDYFLSIGQSKMLPQDMKTLDEKLFNQKIDKLCLNIDIDKLWSACPLIGAKND